jgi:M6 family metalloprotease-like protein
MNRLLSRPPFRLALTFAAAWCLLALSHAGAQQKADKGPALPDLTGYRHAEGAITTTISKASPVAVGRSGYLGVHVNPDGRGKLVVAEVGEDSPAARAGLRSGDLLLKIGGQALGSAEALRDQLQIRSPGEVLKLEVVREGKPLELTATLAATSRPMKVGQQRPVLGVQTAEPKDGQGVAITSVTAGSGAAAAGLKAGDVILRVNGLPMTGPDRLSDTLAEKQPGDTVTLAVVREGKPLEMKAKLGAMPTQGKGFRKGKGGWDTRAGFLWKKDVYRLAVVCVEYPDVAHNPKITLQDWHEALFSRKTFTRTNATGQTAYGSLNDYYQEQSHGRLRVEGKVFDWVTVSKKRENYSQGTGTGNKAALLTEALDTLLAHEGPEALSGFDGIFFLYAGKTVQTTRGGLYWPHKANVFHRDKRWPYFICPEGGARMNTISVSCHEFGHMLGLPDLYARPENPGSEGAGVWCAMSNQVGNGRPQHFCAWSKERLGWIQPVVIHPTTKQKLILRPVEDSPKECFKVLVRADGSEYFLLENRRRKGFDASLPAEGLLIWRVVNGRPILEESHGIEGPAGPRMFLSAVPYPSSANNAFTPFTTPSSRAQLGGGLPVHITNIRRLPDGRITFHIGYEYQ